MASNNRDIDVNDLPKWTNWPERLLGLSKFENVSRDLSKIKSEYSDDKWQRCLDAYHKSGGTLDANSLRLGYYDQNSGNQRACVLDGRLQLATNAEVMARYDSILVGGMGTALSCSKTVVELGCGFGRILWMLRNAYPSCLFRGGDYADSAVELARKLYANVSGLTVEKFDFYAHDFKILDNAEGPVTVLTSQALEQIPSCKGVIDVLAKYRSKIQRVFHMEPTYELYDESMMGLMRRRYIEVNDYNRDLVSVIRSRKDVKIYRIEPNVIGWNPFNSLAFIEWGFV